MVKIAFFNVEDWEREYLKDKLKDHELFFDSGKFDAEKAGKVKEFEVLCTYSYAPVNKDSIREMKNLKLYCSMSTGIDHISLEDLKSRNVVVCNVPAYGDSSIAEYTFALILALSRKLLNGVERSKKGSFSLQGLRGFDLKGKTLGVIGTGRIGRHVIRIAKGFEMKVIAYDMKPDLKLAEEMGFEYAKSLEEVMKGADVLTLHIPLTPHTKHLINEGNISTMKKQSLLINTSRGAIVETSAILRGLKDGVLSGVGLDVLEEENFFKEEKTYHIKPTHASGELKIALENHVLLMHENVLVTPHNAFNSVEARERILDTTIQNITSFLEGKPQNTF